jgi:hypothetical protein
MGRVVINNPATSPPTNDMRRLVGLPGEPTGNFVRIGHSLFALSFAVVGACLSRRLSLGPGVTRRPVVIASGGSGQDDRGRTARGADDL